MDRADFNIIIGAKLDNAEKSIVSMIDNISKNYPLKLKVVLDLNNEASNKLKGILNLLDRIDNTEININSKGLDNVRDKAGKVGKEIQASMSKANKEAKEFENTIKDSFNALDRMAKLSDKIRKDYRGEDTRITKTEVKGNDFYSNTKKYKIGINENGEQLKSLEVEEQFSNYKKLNKEIEKVLNGLDKLRKSGNLTTQELDKFEKELKDLNNIDISTEDFSNRLALIRKQYADMVEQDKQATREKINREQAVLKIKEQQVLWEKRISELEIKGYAHHKQILSLKNKLNQLNEKDLKTLEEVNSHLAKMNEQYQRAVNRQKQTKFESDVVKKSNAQARKNAKLDPELVGVESYEQLEKLTNQMSHSKTFEQFEKSLQKVIVLYDELIERQRTSIDLIKLSNKYNDKVDDIRYKSSDLSEENQQKILQKIAEIQEQVNIYKNRGIDLSIQEQQSLKNNVKELERMVKEAKNLESEEERIARRTQQLEEKFESFSYRASRGLDRNVKELKEIEAMQRKIKDRIDNDLKGLTGKEFDNVYKSIEKDMLDMTKRSREMRDEIRKENASFWGRFQHAMKQVPVWITAMGLFYGSVRQVKQGFESLLEIDSAMINLQKVTEATDAELEKFKTTASEIGKTLGVTTAEVINATTEFQKLGYTLQESSALGKASVLYANVGDINIEDATQSIVSAIKGFDIAVDGSGKNVMKIVDIFNEVSNNYAISAEGIGEALRRSSAVLTQAGNSIEESVALITAANTTIQNPERVGNALKTIAMRIRGVSEEGEDLSNLVPELEKAFNSFGSTIMQDEDTFKSTYDIMKELAKHWDDLTDIQKAYITELIGGKEQGAIVASMIQNWGDAVGAYETALNSAGSAQREFLNYTESFEYKINALKVAIEQFWIALINDEGAKAVIDFLTDMVEVATKAVENFGSLYSLMTVFGSFALIVSGGLRKWVFDGDAVGRKIVDIGDSAKKAKSSFDGWLGTLGKVGSLFTFLVKRLSVFFGVLWGITGVTSFVFDVINMENNERRKKIDTLEDEVKAYETLRDTMESVDIDRYLELNDKMSNGKLNLEEQEEYYQLQQKISDQMPQLISYYDEYGNAVFRTSDEIRNLIKEQEKIYNQNQESLLNLKLEEVDFSELEKEIERINKEKLNVHFSENEAQAYTFARDFIEKNKEALEEGGDELQQKLQELSQKFNNTIDDSNPNKQMISLDFANQVGIKLAQGDIEEALKFLDDYIAKLNTRTMRLSEEVDNSKKDISTKMTEFSTLLKIQAENYERANNIQINSNEHLFVEQIREKIERDITELGEKDAKEIIKKLPEYIENAFESVKKAKIEIGSLFQIEEKDTEESIRKRFDSVISVIKSENIPNAEFLVDVLNELKNTKIDEFFSKTSNSASYFAQTITRVHNGVAQATNKFQSEISELDSVYRQLNSGQELSVFQILDLIENYPQLTKHVQVHNGTLKLSASAIKELAKIKEQEFKNDLRMKREQALSAQKKAKAEIEAIAKEIQAYELLGRAKSKADVQSFYDTQTAKFREEFSNAKTGKEKRALLDRQVEIVRSRKEVEKLVDDYTSLQEEINSIDKLLNTNFTQSLGQLGSGSSSGSGSGSSSGSSNKGVGKSLQDAIYIADQYSISINRLTNAISRLQAMQERYPSFSNQYIDALNKELSLTKEKKKVIDSEIASLQKQINTKSIQQKGVISIDKEDNRTARAKNAELQQQIDEAKMRLEDLKTESEEVQNRIYELYYSFINARKFYYETQISSFDDDLASVEYSLSLYKEGSFAFDKYAKEKMKYLNELKTLHEQELEFLEKEKATNESLTYSQRLELNSMIREARQNLVNARKEIRDFQQELNEIQINIVLERFDREAKEYAKIIEDIRAEIDYDLEDDSYERQIELLKKILSYTKGQESDIKKNIYQLQQMKERYKDNHELVEKITNEIENWEEELRNVGFEERGISKEIKNVYKKIADEIVDIYKEQIQLMKQAEEERYKEIIDKQRKAHDDRMKSLDEELKMLRKIYNERIEMIEREESTRKFNKDINELQKEAEELQKLIDKLSLDDSFEAQAKRTELNKKLSEINLEISERQHEREVELRKQSLQDELEKLEEELEEKKNKYQEDYEEFEEIEEKKRRKRLEELDNMLKDERMFAKLREEVMEGNFDNMIGLLQDWSKEVSGEMSILGDVITRNFTDKVKKAIESLTYLKSINIGSWSNVISTEGTTIRDKNKTDVSGKNKLNEQDYKLLSGKFLTDILTMYTTRESQNVELRKKAHALGDEARKSGATLDPNKSMGFEDVFKQLSDEEKILFSKYMREYTMFMIQSPELIEAARDITGDIVTKARDAIGDSNYWREESFLEALKKYLQGFSSGGYTGKLKNGSAIVKVHDEELILDKKNTQSIKEFLGTDNIVNAIKDKIKQVFNMDNVSDLVKSSLSNIYSPAIPNLAGIGETIVNQSEVYDININIENMTGDNDDLEAMSDRVIKDIKKRKGGRFF